MPEIAINYQPHQPPKKLKFPETIYGKQKRSFQNHWFEKYPWLDYDCIVLYCIVLYCIYLPSIIEM